MTITAETLQKLAELAYLDTDQTQCKTLAHEVNAIIDFVEQLKSVDTAHIMPLYHPIDYHQPLREDIVTEANCLKDLEAIAENFHDGLYWVPKVIDGEER